MELEVGYGLVRLVDASQGGDLLDRISMIRRQIATELGIVVPPIRIRDNMQLEPNEYRIKIARQHGGQRARSTRASSWRWTAALASEAPSRASRRASRPSACRPRGSPRGRSSRPSC